MSKQIIYSKYECRRYRVASPAFNTVAMAWVSGVGDCGRGVRGPVQVLGPRRLGQRGLRGLLGLGLRLRGLWLCSRGPSIDRRRSRRTPGHRRGRAGDLRWRGRWPAHRHRRIGLRHLNSAESGLLTRTTVDTQRKNLETISALHNTPKHSWSTLKHTRRGNFGSQICPANILSS